MNIDNFLEGPLHLAEYVKYGHLLRDLYLGKDLIPEMEVLKIAENSQETQWINDQLRTFRPGIQIFLKGW